MFDLVLPMKLAARDINYLNLGLILISAIIAYFIPFELFLIAYAILGPLHYLTEMAWLHKHEYFSTGKTDYLILSVLGVLATLFFFAPFLTPHSNWGVVFIAIAFFSAIIFTFIKDKKKKIVAFLAIVLAAVLLHKFNKTPEGTFDLNSVYYIFIGVFLPTIIHVSLFTGAFMLYGAMKEKHFSGYLTFGIFLMVSVSFFFIPEITSYTPDSKELYSENTFIMINKYLLGIADPVHYEHHHRDGFMIHAVFDTEFGAMIMRFIAFAYTYHYLNWFSKTTVIGWHKISVPKLVGIGVLWVISIMLYLQDYANGFKVLFLLSLLHVFLEFPLNFKTFQTIGLKIIGTGSKKA